MEKIRETNTPATVLQTNPVINGKISEIGGGQLISSPMFEPASSDIANKMEHSGHQPPCNDTISYSDSMYNSLVQLKRQPRGSSRGSKNCYFAT